MTDNIDPVVLERVRQAIKRQWLDDEAEFGKASDENMARAAIKAGSVSSPEGEETPTPIRVFRYLRTGYAGPTGPVYRVYPDGRVTISGRGDNPETAAEEVTVVSLEQFRDEGSMVESSEPAPASPILGGGDSKEWTLEELSGTAEDRVRMVLETYGITESSAIEGGLDQLIMRIVRSMPDSPPPRGVVAGVIGEHVFLDGESDEEWATGRAYAAAQALIDKGWLDKLGPIGPDEPVASTLRRVIRDLELNAGDEAHGSRSAALSWYADRLRKHPALADGDSANSQLRQVAPSLGGGDSEVPELADLPGEVRRLVHAVDRVLHGWNEPDGKWTNDELWRHLHACNAAVWGRLDPAGSVGGGDSTETPEPGRFVQITDEMLVPTDSTGDEVAPKIPDPCPGCGAAFEDEQARDHAADCQTVGAGTVLTERLDEWLSRHNVVEVNGVPWHPGVSSSDGETDTLRVMRAWQRNDPEPVDVSQVRDTGDRRWARGRGDQTWYLRDIAGPVYTWDELLAVAGPVTEVRLAPSPGVVSEGGEQK